MKNGNAIGANASPGSGELLLLARALAVMRFPGLHLMLLAERHRTGMSYIQFEKDTLVICCAETTARSSS